MKKEIRTLMEKARENMQASKLLRSKNFLDIAISRSYYAMFYSAEAVLLTKGLKFSKHQAVIAAFGKHFAKTKILNEKLHRYLLDTFEERIESDYGPIGSIETEMVDERISQAEEFIKEVLGYLEREGYISDK